ncbi:MAG: hypothetical protein FWC51_04795 [Proteobacteria bacterium]|nr:hypothetical protein [Pseudomonadota bacterium]
MGTQPTKDFTQVTFDGEVQRLIVRRDEAYSLSQRYETQIIGLNKQIDNATPLATTKKGIEALGQLKVRLTSVTDERDAAFEQYMELDDDLRIKVPNAEMRTAYEKKFSKHM